MSRLGRTTSLGVRDSFICEGSACMIADMMHIISPSVKWLDFTRRCPGEMREEHFLRGVGSRDSRIGAEATGSRDPGVSPAAQGLGIPTERAGAFDDL